MIADPTRFAAALDRFDAANAEDPNREQGEPRELVYGRRMSAMLERFAPDAEEAVRLANDTVYGLGAGVWTKDVATMHKLAAKIKSGTVWGNCHAIIDTALDMAAADGLEDLEGDGLVLRPDPASFARAGPRWYFSTTPMCAPSPSK